MEIKISLQFKLLFVISLVIILSVLGLIYLSINNQKNLFYDSFQNLAITLAQGLDAGISNKEELKDTEKLQSNIYKTIWLNPNLTEISVSLPTEDGLKIVASNDRTLVGNTAAPESLSSYEKGIILTKTLTDPDGFQFLSVITPVHVGGQRVGTYNIILSLEPLEKNIYQTQKQFILLATPTILVVIIVAFISIRITVINPIKELQGGMKIIGSGKLDYRIKIKSKDEIGDLASGFNKMAKRLKERTSALAEEKVNLEKKVKERTKELERLTQSLNEEVKQRTADLQGKLEELEKFQKFVVEREMKMVELKKEIEKLRKG